MPINNYLVFGDMEKRGTFVNDIETKSNTIFKNPKAVNKIRKIWEKVPYRFNFYFANLTTKSSNIILNSKDNFKLYLQENKYIHEDAINVVMTHNLTAFENYMPMTAWIMAHRLDHMLVANRHLNFEAEFNYIGNKLYNALITTLNYYDMYKNVNIPYRTQFSTGWGFSGPEYKYLIYNIFTMRSAREKSIRNPLDIFAELLAQYLITGDITFNTDFPEIIDERYRYDHYFTITGDVVLEKRIRTYVINTDSDRLFLKDIWQSLRNDLKEYFNLALSNCVGKTLIW